MTTVFSHKENMYNSKRIDPNFQSPVVGVDVVSYCPKVETYVFLYFSQ
jgi:hypothetical protein